MLRTSLRSAKTKRTSTPATRFLSSNAQDFIEDDNTGPRNVKIHHIFLSSNAQDFIEDRN